MTKTRTKQNKPILFNALQGFQEIKEIFKVPCFPTNGDVFEGKAL